MRTPWLAAFATTALLTGIAYAQAYQYAARTAAPVARSGAVTAGSLTWQCSGSECRISGPWPAPGVAACAALAAQVGRISAYGRSGAMLTTEQLTQCNAGLPATTIQIDPGIAAQIRPQIPSVRPTAPILPGRAPASETMTTPTRTSEVAIEPGSRPEDIVTHILSTPTIRFYGRSEPLPAPALPTPLLRIEGGRITTPGVRLQASAPDATPTPRSTATPETPRYRARDRTDVTLRVPVSLRDMPAETIGIELDCGLYTTRFVPYTMIDHPEHGRIRGPDPAYRDLETAGARSEDHMVAAGFGEAFIRSIGNYETVFDIPMQTRPFYRLQDARSYECTVRLRLARPGSSLERQTLYAIAEPGRPTSRPAFQAAAGTTPILHVEGNLQ